VNEIWRWVRMRGTLLGAVAAVTATVWVSQMWVGVRAAILAGIVVLAGIVLAVGRGKARRKIAAKATCPVCGSGRPRLRISRGVPSLTLGLTAIGWDRECQECGTSWRAACPKWAGWVFLGIGFITMALWFGFIIAMSRIPELGILFLCFFFWPIVLGIWVLVYGLSVVAGKSGQLKILRQGQAPIK